MKNVKTELKGKQAFLAAYDEKVAMLHSQAQQVRGCNGMRDGWGGARVCVGDQGWLAAGGLWENEGRLEEQGASRRLLRRGGRAPQSDAGQGWHSRGPCLHPRSLTHGTCALWACLVRLVV